MCKDVDCLTDLNDEEKKVTKLILKLILFTYYLPDYNKTTGGELYGN
jgi:hypothetical protein